MSAPTMSRRPKAALLAWKQNGWIDHGRLRLLPPQGGVAFGEAW
jgi:hypothetical protein